MTYKFAIQWMKITTWLVIIISIPGLIYQSFDPFYSLEGLILKDVYGNNIPDEKMLIMYRFALGLFSVVSLFYAVLQLYVIKHLIEKGDKKIVKILFTMIIFWVGICAVLIFHFNTWNYFYSVGGMAMMWLPILGWMSFTKKTV